MRSIAVLFFNRILLGCIVVSSALGGCRAPRPDEPLLLPRFHLEESPNFLLRYERAIEMPLSGVPLAIASNLGRRMVLLVNGDPVGVRIIDHIDENGN